MQWWAWITVGAILLAGELAFVDAQFYLVFVGLAALLVGALSLGGLLEAPWLQWVVFALLTAASMVGFRQRVYARLRSNLPTMQHGPSGDLVVCPAELPPGSTCRLEYRGTSWSALNGGASAIAAGARARIERVDGVTLVVRADP
jgi:membrane protein implicated in regulation of membrane protease activity